MNHYGLDCAQIVSDAQRILRARYHVEAKDAKDFQLHDAIAQAVNLAIAPRWDADEAANRTRRRAAYMSAEFLMGRLWHNNLCCLGVYNEVEQLLSQQGACLADMEDIEDAALGNGGLGRLAACYLDAAAAHDIPLTGYGLYYRFGLFKQAFKDDRQVELPDDWTKHGDPWSVRREDEAVQVDFANFSVLAVPHDMPVIGHKGVIRTLRLWKAEPINPVDMPSFADQKYGKALNEQIRAETISALLYPGDSRTQGKLLRLRQQYMLCSATVKDMLRQCKDHEKFAEEFTLQLNDTHPAMAIPELIRLLVEEGMTIEHATDIACKAFNFTNHTVMPEALECWSVELKRQVAPQILPVNRYLDEKLRALGNPALYIVENGYVHMANLCIANSSRTNGVAELHSNILKDRVFAAWHQQYPGKLTNVTNGVTPRRWLGVCNPELTGLLADTLGGDDFLKDLKLLGGVREKIDDQLIDRFIDIKKQKKQQLAAYVLRREGVELPDHFIFDVQVKRLHEYKRQLMNALSLVDIYYQLKENEDFRASFHPVAVVFGAKAAAGYDRAKSIIYFCNKLAKMINSDPEVNQLLRVVFVHNYNCSYAEKIIPAADISQQISPAGTEASGTGNMKLMLNGAVTLGTMDGANIEIVEQAGIENEYIFGATAEEIDRIRDSYRAKDIYNSNERIRRAVDALVDGTVEDPTGGLKALHDCLLEGAHWHRPDHHFILHDFASYQAARLQAYSDYAADQRAFAKKCLMNIAGAGTFSADRAVKQYADEIWHV